MTAGEGQRYLRGEGGKIKGDGVSDDMVLGDWAVRRLKIIQRSYDSLTPRPDWTLDKDLHTCIHTL